MIPNWSEDFEDYDSFELLSRVASLYYLEEKTQSQVAQELGLSRQKVQRLLRQAHEQRIVEIHVHTIPVLHREQETKLKTAFGLDDVVIAPSHPDRDRRRSSVARAAASYLERQLTDGSIVTVGFGRNTAAVSSFFRSTRRIDCTFVSAMGGAPAMGQGINPNTICSNLAARAGAQVQLLYAPAYVENQQIRDMLLNQEAINRSMAMARRADIAIVGIGTPDDDAILVRAGCLSLEEANRLREFGAVGEVLGNFFNETGQEISSDINKRLIALNLEELRRIPKVVAVVSEMEKVWAILSALRSGVIRVLVTDCDNAVAILRQAGITDLKEDNTLMGHH